jgi:hypothetical protein
MNKEKIIQPILFKKNIIINNIKNYFFIKIFLKIKMFTKLFSLLIFSSFLLSIECQVSIYGQCGQCKIKIY